MIAVNQSANIKYKKTLREDGPGQYANDLFNNPSMFSDGVLPYNGKFSVVGPSAHERKWWATVTVEAGMIVKVT